MEPTDPFTTGEVTGDEKPCEPIGRTEESVAAAFPGRGEQPSNEVVVDETLPAAPNLGHPADNRRSEDLINHWSFH